MGGEKKDSVSVWGDEICARSERNRPVMDFDSPRGNTAASQLQSACCHLLCNSIHASCHIKIDYVSDVVPLFVLGTITPDISVNNLSVTSRLQPKPLVLILVNLHV